MTGRGGLGLIVAGLLALLILAAAPWFGAESIDVLGAARRWWGGGDDREVRILSLRLPRIALGFLAGGGLAMAGATFQTLLRNALATPYTLGVSFAGALGAFLVLSFPVLNVGLGPVTGVALWAFLLSAADVAVLYLLSRRPDRIEVRELLLAGVTLNFFCAAAILLLRFLTDPLRLRAMDHWMMGGLSVGGWRDLAAVPVFLVPGVVILLLEARALDQLAFGEEIAASRGVDVARSQRGALMGGCLVTAGVVAVTGPIGFVGLLAPHAVRWLAGPGHRALLPASFLMGGAFLVLADAAARSMAIAGRGSELPVGIVTALVGAPAFLLVLLRMGRR